MSLSEIEAQLPNGLHDAKINSVCRDLKAELVDVHVDVPMGLPDDTSENQNAYRAGVLRFTGAKIVIIEEPNVESLFNHPGSVNFVVSEDESGSISAELLAKLKGEYHTYTFFVQEWFSNVKIAASSVAFIWK
jgi:hypothetical protein